MMWSTQTHIYIYIYCSEVNEDTDTNDGVYQQNPQRVIYLNREVEIRRSLQVHWVLVVMVSVILCEWPGAQSDSVKMKRNTRSSLFQGACNSPLCGFPPSFKAVASELQVHWPLRSGLLSWQLLQERRFQGDANLPSGILAPVYIYIKYILYFIVNTNLSFPRTFSS